MSEHDDKKALVQRRSRIRSAVTKLIKQSDSALALKNLSQIRSLHSMLSSKASQLQQLDNDLLTLWDDDEANADTDECLVYELKLNEALDRLHQVIANSSSTSSTTSVKLPKQTLPTFSGSRLEWTTFWDIYDTAVHQQPNLSDVQKFSYLLSCLKGEAKSSIAGLRLSSTNYHLAVEILFRRFGNDEVVSKEHLKSLQNLKSPIFSVPSLNAYRDEIFCHVRSLQALNVAPEMYEVVVLPSLISKLPDQVKLGLMRNSVAVGKDTNSIENFLSLLQEEINIHEKLLLNDDVKRLTVDPPSVKSHASPSAISLPSTSKTIFCTYCGGDHNSASCKTISLPKRRLAFLKSTHRCFLCLRKGHQVSSCNSQKSCPKCHRKHHVSICYQSSAPGASGPDDAQTPSAPVVQEAPVTQSQTFTLLGSNATVMPTAKVLIKSPSGEQVFLTRVLFDTGSNKTFIKEEICSLLGLGVEREEKMKISTFANPNELLHSSKVVRFEMCKPDNSNPLSLTANSVPQICPTQKSFNLVMYPHFCDLDLADPFDFRDKDLEIGLLVGCDHFFEIVTGQTIRGKEGPVALSSKLGWLACGNLTLSDSSHSSCLLQVACTDASIHDQLQKFWELDHLGVSESEFDAPFPPVIDFDGRYSVQLPWKIEKSQIDLDSNFDLAKRRLSCCVSKLKSDVTLLNEYCRILDDQFKKGVIEEVPDEPSGSLIHFLPHSPVIRPSAETTKVRIVFDAAAKDPHSRSLNDFLEKGTSSIPQIPVLLFAFRFHKIGLLADLEKAFLQIRIDPTDRDALRFLWLDSPLMESSNIKCFRYTSLVFGLSCSPSILESVIKTHLEKFKKDHPSLMDKVGSDMYVDNLVTGCSSVEEGKDLFKISKDIFQQGGFNLRQWKSNSSEFLSFVQSCEEINANNNDQSPQHEDDSPYSAISLHPIDNECDASSNQTKLLGLHWDTKTDRLIINTSNIGKEGLTLAMVKRSVLSVTSKVFDPLGFLSPILLTPKLLFQEMCSGKIHWDSPLTPQMEKRWVSWLNEMAVYKLEIERLLLVSKPISSIQIHGFSDASSLAYAAVLFLRVEYEDGSISCKFLASKLRVAPLKRSLSIPRLELMGAVLLARLIQLFSARFPAMASLFCWSDSIDVLHWLKNEQKIRQAFVQNRVLQIRSICEPAVWNHVPGTENPADIATRELTPSQLMHNSLWWNGPPWLSDSLSTWPSTPLISRETEEAEEAVVNLSGSTELKNISNVVQLNRYSSYGRLLRVTAYVLRFIGVLRKRCERPNSVICSATEISNAERMWFKDLQASDFSSELSHIKNKTAATSLNKNLNLYINKDGLLCSQGRISCFESGLANSPILVPRNKAFEKLIILDSHARICHGGVSASLCKIRESFWILRGRQRVKSLIRNCVTCRKISGHPFKGPDMPQLPDFRVATLRPFSTVGLDYCGPILFRDGEESRKAYIVLFTCSAVRAVHLEVVPDMTVASFLRALRKFVSRRGIPSIISDNASQFKAAFRILNCVSEADEVQQFAADRRIVWNFIVEKAPWMGGFYERLIGVVKISLKKCLLSSLVTIDELSCLVCEVEGVVNSRPLAYVPSDLEEEPLTPSHFLCLTRLTKLPAGTVPRLDLTLPMRMTATRRMLNLFWRTFYKSYILSLREHASFKQSADLVSSPYIGQVVLITEDKVPRLRWRLGRIVELVRGRDDQVRSAILKVPVRSSNTTSRAPETIRRPLKLLIPLECT